MGDIFSAIQQDTAGFTLKARRDIANAQWISVAPEISEAAITAVQEDFEAARPRADGTRELFAPLTSKPPAPQCVVYNEDMDAWVLCITGHDVDPDMVFLLTANKGRMEAIASYTPGRSEIRMTQAGVALNAAGQQGLQTQVVHVANILSLVNTPAYCTRVPHGTRQVTRSLRRTFDTEHLAISRIVWSIHDPKTSVTTEGKSEDRHMPLHYTRGHWRVAQPHFTRATMHDDGICRQWIEGFWSGHPAYGIKKALYTPKL